jgi:hypothetical protein
MRAWFAVVLVVPVVAFAQSRDEEISIARSAAPPEIAKDAKVYVLDHGHYVVADPGRSAEVCMVGRPGAADFAPMCGDAEMDASELAIGRFRTEQRLAGRSKEEIDRAIEDGMKSGRFREPTRPALLFMLSSTQQLTDTAGKPVGKWYPHIMVYYPGHLTNETMGLVDSKDVNMPSVSADHHGSMLVVVERNWVDPEPKLVTEKTPGN